MANPLIQTYIKLLVPMTHIERTRLLVLLALSGLAICIFNHWGDPSALQLAQSLLGVANMGVSQVEKRLEKKGK